MQNKASTTEAESKMASVKKDNVLEHDGKRVEGVLQQSCSRLSVEMSTKHVALLQTDTLPKWEAEGMCRDQLLETESVKGMGDYPLKNANVNQTHKPRSQAHQGCNENQDICKLSSGSPVKVADMKHYSDCGTEKHVMLQNPQPLKNCKSDHVICKVEPDTVDVVPESPLSDCDACSSDLYGAQNREQGCLGGSPSFERESEPESPMDVDNSKNSCQGSEADEETSPLLEDQEDIDVSKAPNKFSRLQRTEVELESRKSQFASWRGESNQFSLHLEGVDNPAKESETLSESSVVTSECKGAKHCGKKDSKITSHFMRVPRAEEKR